MTIVFTYISCEHHTNIDDDQFEAEVMGRNFDCGLYAIKFIDKLDRVEAIAETESSGDVYIAKNLPEEFQVQGLMIILSIRKIQPAELSACTAMGPGYSWIYVTEARLK